MSGCTCDGGCCLGAVCPLFSFNSNNSAHGICAECARAWRSFWRAFMKSHLRRGGTRMNALWSLRSCCAFTSKQSRVTRNICVSEFGQKRQTGVYARWLHTKHNLPYENQPSSNHVQSFKPKNSEFSNTFEKFTHIIYSYRTKIHFILITMLNLNTYYVIFSI